MKSTVALTILGAICSGIIPKIIDKLLLKKSGKHIMLNVITYHKMDSGII